MTAHRTHLGFTLVELMVVVAIVAILAAVAFPVYQNYVKRTRMAEVVMALGACRTPVAEAYQTGSGSGGPGANNWGCEKAAPASRFVQTIATQANGRIVVTAQGFSDSAIDGKIVTMTPMIDGAVANPATDMGKAVKVWRCGAAADGTTVPLTILPASCRDS